MVRGVIVALLIAGHCGCSSALSCACNKQKCERPENCASGRALDACSCCLECSKTLNQSCGGLYNVAGVCGYELYCEFNADFGEKIFALSSRNYGAVGVCKECRSHRQFGCQILDGECDCGVSCTLQFPFSSRHSCDMALNDSSLQKCNYVTCPSNIDVEECPHDSVRPPPKLTHNGCCEKTQPCVCPQTLSADEVCPLPPVCDSLSDQLPVVVLPGSGTPGSCCPLYRCAHRSALRCHRGNTTYANGEVLTSSDSCQTCSCKDGVIYCTPLDCPKAVSAAVASCGWHAMSDDGCCIVCKGCVSQKHSATKFYPIGSSWQETDCITCECDRDGVSHCYTNLCKVGCVAPRKIAGQCCPACDVSYGTTANETQGTVTASTVPMLTSQPSTVACPSLNASCNKLCVHGLMKDKDNCDICHCNPCPVPECTDTAECTASGGRHAIDEHGCETCHCKHDDYAMLQNFTSSHVVIPTSPACFTSQGHSYTSGESWFDGCRQCYCFGGHELCALIACPLLRCSPAVLRPGSCCPTCPGSAAVQSEEVILPPFCAGTNGSWYSDSEHWQLDKCTACLCHRGQALCESQQCAPALCEQPRMEPGACCPSCPGLPATTSIWRGQSKAASNYKQGCKTQLLAWPSTVSYRHGDVWRVSDCQTCTCQHGALHCYSQSCTPTNAVCRHLPATLSKGQCCPVCAADEWACFVNGSRAMEHGSTWMSGCLQCTCRHGSVVCIPLPCSDSQEAPCVAGQDSCCHRCRPVGGDSSAAELSPLTTGLLTLLSVFAAVIVLLVVVAIRRPRRPKSTALTAIPRVLEKSAINNKSSLSPASRELVGHKLLTERRPKSTNLEFLSVSSSHFVNVSTARDADCLKPLVEGCKNDYVHC